MQKIPDLSPIYMKDSGGGGELTESGSRHSTTGNLISEDMNDLTWRAHIFKLLEFNTPGSDMKLQLKGFPIVYAILVAIYLCFGEHWFKRWQLILPIANDHLIQVL